MFALDDATTAGRAGIEEQFARHAERKPDRVAFLPRQLSPARLVLSDNGSRDTRSHREGRNPVTSPLPKGSGRRNASAEREPYAGGDFKQPSFHSQS